MKNRSYSAMSKYHLFDKNLSFKAKRLLSSILCVPDTWEFSVKGLAAMVKDGIDIITTSLKELKNSGYIERYRSRNEKGRANGTEYIIYEKPINFDDEISADELAEKNCGSTSSNYDSTDKEEEFFEEPFFGNAYSGKLCSWKHRTIKY